MDGRITEPSTSGGQRGDSLVDVTALQKFDSAAGTLRIRSYHGPRPFFTGGAMLAAEGPPTVEAPQACAEAKGTAHEVDTLYNSGWTNEAGAPLVAHMSWGGNITVPDLQEGRIDVYTVTK
jgi:hypothetical protein